MVVTDPVIEQIQPPCKGSGKDIYDYDFLLINCTYLWFSALYDLSMTTMANVV